MSTSPAFAATRFALAAVLALQAPLAGAQATSPHPLPARPAATVGARTAQAAVVSPSAPLVVASPCGRLDIAPLVRIPVGKSTVIKPAAPVSRILLGNPENARAARPAETPDPKKDEGVKAPPLDTRPGVADVDVLLLGPNEIYLLGKTIGATNVVMLDRNGGCTAFDVVVGMDTSALQSVIEQLLPEEKGLKVTAAFDSVVLSGMVSDSEALARVTDLTNAYVRGQQGGNSAANYGPAVNDSALSARLKELGEKFWRQGGLNGGDDAVCGFIRDRLFRRCAILAGVVWRRRRLLRRRFCRGHLRTRGEHEARGQF